MWKFEGSRLTVEDGEFDYDLAALSVDEQHDGEQNRLLNVIPVKQTKKGKFHKKQQLSHA